MFLIEAIKHKVETKLKINKIKLFKKQILNSFISYFRYSKYILSLMIAYNH